VKKMSDKLSLFEKEVLLCLEEAGETNFTTLLHEAAARHEHLDFGILTEKMFGAVQSLLEKDFIQLRSPHGVSGKQLDSDKVLLNHMAVDEVADNWRYDLVFRADRKIHFISFSGDHSKMKQVNNVFRALGEISAGMFSLEESGNKLQFIDGSGLNGGGIAEIVIKDKGWDYIEKKWSDSGWE